MLSTERSRTYDSGGGVHDPALMKRALGGSLADGSHRFSVGARIPPELAVAAKRFSGTILPEPGACYGSVAGVYVLEDAHALEAWFGAPPDLRVLLDEARALFASIEAWSEPENQVPSWYGATRGALILAYARLCRIAQGVVLALFHRATGARGKRTPALVILVHGQLSHVGRDHLAALSPPILESQMAPPWRRHRHILSLRRSR